MKKIFLAVIFVINTALGYSQNQDAAALLQKANESYANKEYGLAAELYEQIVAQGVNAPELNYNLGNAYYKSGNFTKAIVNYERALKLLPDFEDAKNNLKMANTHLRDKLKPVPESAFSAVFERFVTSVGLNTWAVMCLVCLAVGLFLFGLYFFSTNRNLRKFAFSFGFVFIVLCFVNLTLGFYNSSVNKRVTQAIVTEPVVTIKSSPDEAGTDLFRIHEGLKVLVKDKSGDWIEIRLADGRVGWIKSSSLENI